MSYPKSLEAAGAKVLVYEEFGDWQGTWLALVEYKGEKGWIKDYFGSCSVCDAFLAEFDWGDDKEEDYQKRLKEFGLRYLDAGLRSNEEILDYVKKDSFWDLEREKMLSFVEEAIKEFF